MRSDLARADVGGIVFTVATVGLFVQYRLTLAMVGMAVWGAVLVFWPERHG